MKKYGTAPKKFQRPSQIKPEKGASTTKTIDEMLDIVGNQLEMMDKMSKAYNEARKMVGPEDAAQTMGQMAETICELSRTAIELSRMKAYIEGGGITGLLSGFSTGL